MCHQQDPELPSEDAARGKSWTMGLSPSDHRGEETPCYRLVPPQPQKPPRRLPQRTAPPPPVSTADSSGVRLAAFRHMFSPALAGAGASPTHWAKSGQSKHLVDSHFKVEDMQPTLAATVAAKVVGSAGTELNTQAALLCSDVAELRREIAATPRGAVQDQGEAATAGMGLPVAVESSVPDGADEEPPVRSDSRATLEDRVLALEQKLSENLNERLRLEGLLRASLQREMEAQHELDMRRHSEGEVEGKGLAGKQARSPHAGRVFALNGQGEEDDEPEKASRHHSLSTDPTDLEVAFEAALELSGVMPMQQALEVVRQTSPDATSVFAANSEEEDRNAGSGLPLPPSSEHPWGNHLSALQLALQRLRARRHGSTAAPMIEAMLATPGTGESVDVASFDEPLAQLEALLQQLLVRDAEAGARATRHMAALAAPTGTSGAAAGSGAPADEDCSIAAVAAAAAAIAASMSRPPDGAVEEAHPAPQPTQSSDAADLEELGPTGLSIMAPYAHIAHRHRRLQAAKT